MLARQVHVAQLTCQAEELGLADEILAVDGFLLLLFKNKSAVWGGKRHIQALAAPAFHSEWELRT